MGAQLNIDASTVRVHTDPEAGSIARSVRAAAFTHGDDIYFAPGSYQPSTQFGQHTLAHELSHVAAQRAGLDAPRGGGLTVGRSDDPAEAAAERSADRTLTALRRTRPSAESAAAESVAFPRTAPGIIDALRREPGDGKTTEGSAGDSDGGVATLTREEGPGGTDSDSTPAVDPSAEPTTEDRKGQAKRARNKRRRQQRQRKKSGNAAQGKQPAEEAPADPTPAERQATAQARAGEALLISGGARATDEAQTVGMATEDKDRGKAATAESMWARSLAGADPAKAQRLLAIRRAIGGPETVTWLEANSTSDDKLDYVAGNAGQFPAPFDAARFDLFFGRQADVPILEGLLAPAGPLWTVDDIQNILTVTARSLSKPQQAKLLDRARTEAWDATQLAALIDGLPKSLHVHLGVTDSLGKEITERGKAWSFADIGTVMKDFHAKTGNLPGIEKFLAASRACELTADESCTLARKCGKNVLLGFADPATDLHQQFKEAKAKAAWTDFAKVSQLFEAFYAKQADCAMLAKLVKASAKYNWTQDSVKLLVDGVKAAALKDVAETEDLHAKVAKVSKRWENWSELASVIDTGYDNAMTKDDVRDLLGECGAFTGVGKYEAPQAKAYIIAAARARGYSWKDRLAQAQKFRNHVQPAGPTNDFGGTVVGSKDYLVTGDFAPRTARVQLMKNKLLHFMDGHSYEAFYFSIGNCRRAPFSSMWAPGTSIGAKAYAAVSAGLSDAIKNIALNNGGGDRDERPDYAIAYNFDKQISAPVPSARGRKYTPGVYGIFIGMFYPDGAWLHHELNSELAVGIGKLRGYIPQDA